jgi:phosphohistidine swiveling domain-containing protein
LVVEEGRVYNWPMSFPTANSGQRAAYERPAGGRVLVWFARAGEAEAGRGELGGKATHLMTLAAGGLPVPPGFCLTTAAYRAFLAYHGLSPESEPAALRTALAEGELPEWLDAAIRHAGEALASAGGSPFAVRSSATVEDLAQASFAGQAVTVLGVQGDTELLAAVRQCWASLWSERARAYSLPAGAAPPQMAVIVQQLVACDVSGIAFTIDPLDGSPEVVVEAVPGLGEELAAGRVGGERYRVDRSETAAPVPAAPGCLLHGDWLARVVALAREAENLLGAPQDVEWGLQGDLLYLFQSRPITVRPASFFSDHLPGDTYLWTAGFFNERFPRPVTPLGWTLLRELLVPLALHDPLRFLGVPEKAIPPLVKLTRGHPYANVAAFQMLYAVFPDRLLPADAYRYFPGGDASLRHRVAYPRSIWQPRTAVSLAIAFLRQPAAASPWLNWWAWERFERHHRSTLGELEAALDAGPPAAGSAPALWHLHERAQALNHRLLHLHRWSLTLADLTYTVLRRMLAAWLPGRDPDPLAARLVAGLPSYSLALDRALHRLAAGEISQAAFMERFGHRSFDVDIGHPPFAERPEQVAGLAARLAASGTRPDFEARARERRALEREVAAALRWWQRPLWRGALGLAQRYVQLRENQRFVWQQTLALQRRIFLALGAAWLDEPERVFCATLDEVRDAALGQAPLPLGRIRARCAELHRLEEDHRRAPALTYPAFLEGDRPLLPPDTATGLQLQGLPVSPGVARGPARIVLSPAQFDRVRAGDVLVTRGADPGWTPLFGLLAGLILEVGGQLSHGAVVAREYGLPAVAALPGITTRLADGELVTLDGRTGTVVIERGLGD